MKRNMIALAIITTLSASAMAGENTWKDETKDAWIDGKAEATLLFNTKLNSFKIDTDVNKGKVTLSGKVESQADKALAESVVREIDGVTDVNNILIVLNNDNDAKGEHPHTAMKKKMHNMTGDPLVVDEDHSVMVEDERKVHKMDKMKNKDDASPITDAKISTLVKSRLLLESEVSGTSIDVDVENRVVTLKGSVKSESERQMALSIAKNTDDVNLVKDELKIKPEKY